MTSQPNTERRTVAKPPHLRDWPPTDTVEYGPARPVGTYTDDVTLDVYVNGEHAGTVTRHHYTAEHPIYRGARIVTRGRHNGAVEWQAGGTDGAFLGSRLTKADAADRVLSAYRAARSAK